MRKEESPLFFKIYCYFEVKEWVGLSSVLDNVKVNNVFIIELYNQIVIRNKYY